MNDPRRWVSLAAALAVTIGIVRADDAKPAVAPSRPMAFEAAREKTFAWAAKTERPPGTVTRLWENVEAGVPARGVAELVIRSFSAAEPSVAELLGSIDLRQPPLVAPDVDSVLNGSEDEFFRTNLGLHTGRLLTDARLYDEALAVFEAVDWAEAVDPAAGLFYKAVCEHQLLMKEEGLKTIARLEAAEGVPESYSSVARLMRAELEALEPESLGEVAGLMRDVERRLDLARGGQRVQKKEDEITARLDEMIKKIEQQMSQSNSGGSGSNGGRNRSNNPLGESVVKGETAPGEVDPKNVRREGGWGDLPPREREAAKNEIEKAFPSNYGRLINEYFLKRARVARPAE